MPPVAMLLGIFYLLISAWNAEAVTPAKAKFSCIGQPLDTYIPDYEVSGCREFYLCSKAEAGKAAGQPSVLTLTFMCPVGHAFDTKLNDCRNASTVTCNRQAAAATRTVRKVNSTISQKLQQIPEELKTSFKCIGRKLGFYYSDPDTNCSTFHLCTKGETKNEILNFQFKCLQGEVFDDAEQTCVSYKSDCNSLAVPPTTTTTTTSTTTTTTTTPSTTTTTATDGLISQDYIYDNANISDYDYYENPESPPTRRRRSAIISVQNVMGLNVEEEHAIERRQISSRTTALSADALPSTSFSCEGKVPGGHYADVETDCQMYHVCAPGPHGTIQNFKFLCSNGTIFSQQTRTCQAWHTVECGSTSLFYSLNEELSRVEPQGALNQDQQLAVQGETIPAASTSNAGGSQSGRGSRKRKSRRRRPKKPKTTTTEAPLFQHQPDISPFDQPPITILDPPAPTQQFQHQQPSRVFQPLNISPPTQQTPEPSTRQQISSLSGPPRTSEFSFTSQPNPSNISPTSHVSDISSSIQTTNASPLPVSQAGSFDAFIQAALRQEQEQRQRLGPILEQRRRQQEAEEQQRRQQEAEEEQRRRQQEEQEQRRFLVQQNEQQRILQHQEERRVSQQQEEQRKLQAAEQLNRQFEQHAPSSSTSQQTTRRRKRPKTTTTPAPIIEPLPEIPAWHVQESHPSTTPIASISGLPQLPQLRGPIETPLPNLPILPTFTTTAAPPRPPQHVQLPFQLPSDQPQGQQLPSFSAPSQEETLPQFQQIPSAPERAPARFPAVPQSRPHSQSLPASTQLLQTPQEQPQIQSQQRPPHVFLQPSQDPPAPQQFQTQQPSFRQPQPQIPQFQPSPTFSPQFPVAPAPPTPTQPPASFQTLTVTQPGVDIEAIILEHLRNAQNLRSGSNLAQQQRQQRQPQPPIFLASPSQPQFSFAQPLGVQSRLINFNSPTSRGFELTTGAVSHSRLGRSTRPLQDFKRFKPIAVKLAENIRQRQEERQHELQQTTFTCKGKVAGGYYADITTGCQMFHICSQGRDESVVYDFRFVCANWTLFDQRSQTCSAEGKVRCHDSVKYYPKKLLDEPEVTVPEVELLKIRIKRAVQVEKVIQAPNQIHFPSTNFMCGTRILNRYYGDYETNCQMFHLCTKSSTGKLEDHRFLCRNGTVFDERSQACDDQTDALNCIDDPNHYGIGEEIVRQR